jgi:hypothetical protein
MADNIYKLLIKYNLTTAAFISNVLASAFLEFKDKYSLIKEQPFNVIVPRDNRSIEERYQELKRKGLTVTRKEAVQRRKIREEMEKTYIKEGEDVWIKGDSVKIKTIYDSSKLNKEITEYTPSFRKTISDDMNPVILEYYTDAMKDMVETYKMKRKKDERESKKRRKNK